jgi:tripartite-type tricarboxylate transporter receptor subunit TctC
MKALASADVREKLSAQGVEVVGGTQAEFADWLAKESQRWGKVIKERNITVE